MGYALRREVYLDEQGLPGLDFDDVDVDAIQLVAIGQGELIGTLRIAFMPEHAKIGRVAVRQDHRRQGIARALLEDAMRYYRERGEQRMYLTSQSDRTAVYEAVGFKVFGEEIMLVGLPHRTMKTY